MPGDPYWAPPLAAGETFVQAVDRPPRRLRIARYADPVITETPVDAACLAAYDEATKLLLELGHEVDDIVAPDGARPRARFRTRVVGAGDDDAGAAQAAPTRCDRSHNGCANVARRCQVMRTRWRWRRLQVAARRILVDLFDYDAVLTPTLASPPVAVGALRDDADPARDFENQKRFTPFTAVANLTGQPAITVAAGVGRDRVADRRDAHRSTGR